jgi:HJR/Mrr/RecB family endonuclease
MVAAASTSVNVVRGSLVQDGVLAKKCKHGNYIDEYRYTLYDIVEMTSTGSVPSINIAKRQFAQES